MFEKESFYPSAALNCAITDTSVSFDPQLPLGNKAGTSLSPESDRLIPPGIMMLKDGKMRLNFMAPGAQSVTAEVHRKIYTLEKAMTAFGARLQMAAAADSARSYSV